MRNLPSLLLSLTLVCGCEIREKGETIKTSGKEATDPALKLQLVSGDSPDLYSVVFSAGETKIIYRSDGEREPMALRREDHPKDSDVRAGETYRYWLKELADRPPRWDDPPDAQITIPKDILLRGKHTLETIVTSGRLFLEGATIEMKQNLIQVVAAQIFSKDSQIQSFGKDETAAPGMRGRDGGLIYVKTKRAKGDLTVIARGENGGSGLPGIAGSDGKPGAAGKNAEIEIKPGFSPRARDAYQKLLEQPPSSIPLTHRDWALLFMCKTTPTDGAQGERGEKGGAGGNGLPGGDSSRLWIEIEDSKELDFHLLNETGLGGIGGTGGKGGVGGIGGEAGKRDRHQLCPEAQPGKRGEEGLMGDSGEPGVAGAEGKYCLKLGTGKVGDCATAPHYDPRVQ